MWAPPAQGTLKGGPGGPGSSTATADPGPHRAPCWGVLPPSGVHPVLARDLTR